MASNLFISTTRSLTPIVAGLVLSLTGRLGIPVDSERASLVVFAGLAGAYYLAVRGLEYLAERMAWRPLQVAAGLLLGWARPPAYGQPPVLPANLQGRVDALHQDLAALKRIVGADVTQRPGGDRR